MKKIEILPFMTWMNLQGIMLSDMGKKITMWFHLQVESKNQNKQKTEINVWTQKKKKNWQCPGQGGTGLKKIGNHEEVHFSNYKIKKLQGYNVHH